MNRAYLRPPLPLYRTGAGLLLPLFVWTAVSIGIHRMPVLQRFYLKPYLGSIFTLPSLPSFGPAAKAKAEYEVLLGYGPRGREVLVTAGTREVRGSALRPVLVPMRHGALSVWLRRNIYGGKDPLALIFPSALLGLLGWSVIAGLGYILDQERHLAFRSEGRHLEGPEKVSERQFRRSVKGDGFGISLEHGRWRKPGLLRIQRTVEAQHQLFQGETGSGKTQAMLGLVDQFEAQGDTCVIYDPHREFLKRYYNPERGDVILGPDTRCAYWDPSSEVDYTTVANADATALSQAASLYPGRVGQRDWFFTNSARLVFQHAMTNYRPDAGELAELMTHADPLIDAIAKGTELEEMLRKNTEGLRASIISTLTQCLFALRQVPEADADRPVWSAREWANKRRGWIFLTSTQDTREAFSHLQRLWIDSVIRNLLSLGEQPNLSTVRVILDELPTLGMLSNLMSAATEGRKSGVDLVMGYQASSAVKSIYRDDAPALLSAPYTVVILRTGEPESAEWASKRLGDEELERIREHRAANGQRSYTTEQRVERIVPQAVLAGLENRHGYLRYAKFVVPIKIAIAPARPDRTVGWVPRTGEAPVCLPMPNLNAIRSKEAAEKEAEARRRAEAVYTPPSQPATNPAKRRGKANGENGTPPFANK